MKNNNKGFSYVELMLVMAIMAILVGLIALSMGLVSRTNVTRGAEKLYSSLSQARSTSLAKGSTRGSLVISCEGGKYYCYVGDPGSPNVNDLKEELVSSPVEIGYYVQGDDTLYKIAPGTSITIQYNQSTGAFASTYTDLVLINGDNTAAIKLHIATGKSELVY